MKKIFIIRHGQSLANAEHQIAGILDSPLSELGRKQARYAGQTISDFFAIDLLITSPMARASETAELIRQEIGLTEQQLVVCDDLQERNLGSLEGQHYQLPTIHADYELAERAPGIEPLDHLAKRAHQALSFIRQRSENNIIVVTHNGMGRMLQTVAQQRPLLDIYKQNRLENAILYPLLGSIEQLFAETSELAPVASLPLQ
jgi:probable phosphoglycerate mutase